jgi:cyanophycinase
MKRVFALIAFLLCSLPLSLHAETKGKLFIIGGGTRPASMMKQFIAMAERVRSGKIVVFPMASATPEEVGSELVAEFKNNGAKSVVSVNLTREQASLPESSAILSDAGGIYFAGGDQARITKALLDTPVHRKLLEIYENGAVIGGTSAGAAVMSEIMITGDEKRTVQEGHDFETIQADNVVTTKGLGFIKAAIVDQHFATRKRHNRLISLIAEYPQLLGIGVDESTAIIVNPEGTFDVIGEKDVVVYDPARAKVQITAAKSIGISNMVMHVLLPGTRFSLKTRKILD